jgi:hypothetical protein
LFVRKIGATQVPAFCLITIAVLMVHGFHPLADDGAVYVAGIKKLVDQGLFQTDAVFALSPTRLSIFAHVLAGLVRCTHLSLPVLLLICQLGSIYLFLLGCWKVATRIFPEEAARWGAVLLAACCFTLPVAGTSLCIMDPYVTARSFSLPVSLFAFAAGLGKQWGRAVAWVVVAALVHPLMAGYAAIALVVIAFPKHRVALFVVGWFLGGLIFLATLHPDLGLAYNSAALSRSYFFLSGWQWYEYLGLVLPLLLLGWGAYRGQALAGAAVVLGGCALLVSVCFVHRSGSLLLARVQVLRAFQIVYLFGVLVAGGLLGRLRQKWAVGALYVVIALALFIGQWFTYPASNHLEWPGTVPVNSWSRAFLWIRDNTPRDAIFALDNDYVESAGEDAQGFRATAERSAVADYFKDGGIASNFRAAADPWVLGSTATAQLNLASDAQRVARLRPLGVGWIVLPAQTATSFPCPFVNAGVRVCRIGAK